MVGGERPEIGDARFRRFMEGLRQIDREHARKAPASQGQVSSPPKTGRPGEVPDRPTSTSPPED
jgi:hypothetical protein